jgi:hypothetical protein
VAILVVPVLLLTGSQVNAQKKPGMDKDANSEKMIKAGILTGKVAAIYEDKRKIRLAVPVPTLNPAGLQGIQQAQIQMLQARMSRNPVAMIAAQRALIQAQANLYTTTMQDVELQAMDDVVVRTARPREEFDEKGKIKRLTKAELKELKGPDPKMPGFKAEFGDVSTDQVVQVTLVRKKPAGPVLKANPVKAKPRAKAKDDDLGGVDLLADNLPQISMIIILAEPPPSK